MPPGALPTKQAVDAIAQSRRMAAVIRAGSGHIEYLLD